MYSFFFFNDTATTEIYTLSLHDALPISACRSGWSRQNIRESGIPRSHRTGTPSRASARCACSPSALRRERSEEHTSELQSRQYLVCRLLLEKKKNSEDT